VFDALYLIKENNRIIRLEKKIQIWQVIKAFRLKKKYLKQ
jgi:hypothetical protein